MGGKIETKKSILCIHPFYYRFMRNNNLIPILL